MSLPSLVVCVPLLVAAAWSFIAAMRVMRPAPAAVASLGLVAIAHGLVLAAFFPGLIISDALHVYASGQRGVVDDYYGYLWPLALNAARAIHPSPATMSVLQLAYFVGVLAYFAAALRRAGEPTWVAVAALLLLGLAPAVVCSVTYQHRDVFTALLSLHWAVLTWRHAETLMRGQGRELNRALAVQATLLTMIALARPELVVAGVATLAALALARRRSGHDVRPALVAALAALVAPLLYTVVATRVLDVEKRELPYLVTLFAQPVGFILTRPDADVHAGMHEAADRIFGPGQLVATHTPRNLTILYSGKMPGNVAPQAYADFYRHSVRLIVSNLPEAIANRVMVYLHGNGYGRWAEHHQDIAGAHPETFERAGFERLSPRPEALASVADWVKGSFEGSRIRRGLTWGTLPLLAVGLGVLLAAPPGGAPWLVSIAILLRAAALFAAAPSAQLAYHLSVLFMGVALVAMGLPALRARLGRRHPHTA